MKVYGLPTKKLWTNQFIKKEKQVVDKSMNLCGLSTFQVANIKLLIISFDLIFFFILKLVVNIYLSFNTWLELNILIWDGLLIKNKFGMDLITIFNIFNRLYKIFINLIIKWW